ncbi:uncharacterized protein LOC111408597 [Olea europaea var. sylvestris]|uniref:uncharacterized protein LOC111408597 n=1 Tax=Olea europaea var. sylvestris TaxID=158386 RepID=UPI000C1D700E|nr:uncharacterized protein LOC111408597 [Olea europaea var. sylvestris]
MLQEGHDSKIGGHSVYRKTYKRISENVYWEGMIADIQRYVWEDIVMDFIEGLPKLGNMDTILVVVDRLSKYGHFIGLKHPFKAASVAGIFIKEVVRLHGVPRSIVSDRDKIFVLYGREPPALLRFEKGSTLVSVIEQQLLERDRVLEELKVQLLQAQTKMKSIADRKRRNVHFNVGDHRIGKVAYKLILPPTCNIHPVFHVSKLRKAEGAVHAVKEVPSQLSEELEMLAEPETLLGMRPGLGSNIRGLDVLIQWKGLPPLEATWESYDMIKQQFLSFHLEDKVKLMGGGNDRPSIHTTYQRHKQGSRGIDTIAGTIT